jgi:hypothetical protein
MSETRVRNPGGVRGLSAISGTILSMRYGYARVSTRDQNPDSQHDALAAAGCERVFIDLEQCTVDAA